MSKKCVVLLLMVTLNLVIGSTVNRVKRQKFRGLQGCTVSHQEINELIRLTKDLNAATDGIQLETRADFDIEAANRDRCAKQLAEFRGTMQTVLKNYKTINRDTMNQAQYERAKSRYQTDIQRLLRRIDNLKRDVEDSFREEVDNLRSNMQLFKNQLDDNLSLLEKERARSRAAFLRLCIANVRAGRINDAVTDFRELEELPYEQVVTEVYENQQENLNLVFNFLEAVDLSLEPVRGYEVLYQHMKRNNQLNGADGRRLLLHIQALIKAADTNSRPASKLLKTLKADVQ